MSASARLANVCSTFDSSQYPASLINLLDELSKDLARSQGFRVELGDADPPVWPHLRRLWTEVVSAHQLADGDDTEALKGFCLSLARFTRNLAAAVPSNQARAITYEPDIRSLLHHYTSFFALEEKSCLPVTRMLIQTLSNLVTANEQLTKQIWDQYMSLPMEEFILIRLLTVPDETTVLATLVFILNCVHPDKGQLDLLTRSKNGPRLCVSLLDQIGALFDKEESSDGGRAFEIGYTIVTRLIEEGLVPELYLQISVEDEVVTPHQTILLKLLDSYLHSSQSHGTAMPAHYRTLCDLLVSVFFALSLNAQHSIRRALGMNDEAISNPQSSFAAAAAAEPPTASPSGDSQAASLQEVDLLLPKICEALVLTTQCLVSLCLLSEEKSNTIHVASERREDRLHTTDGAASAGSLKGFVGIAVSTNGCGFIETLIETLQLFDLFLPRITFGKVAPSPVLAGGGDPSLVQGSKTPSPTRHEDILGGNVADPSPPKTLSVDPKGFLYLKRDLVRLLGILSFGSKQIQDRVRACGGIPVVLNLCVVDERNPYLREHAIFTLRNLLDGNAENQAVVDEIQPIRDWDVDGELQGRTRI
ncbi:spinocerebellar ataxia type 10 protein domain-containing protein [Cristinia sonorae]|uniref:Ataxin-10 homolog n=1 Tax=Cristinia sonorae TaxID=1940300 RepID=A0A8K0UJV9_9AGAR|nr:spinocerebellar ataxia type 10 protein domain-containing protein [Cristinia sonorae]